MHMKKKYDDSNSKPVRAEILSIQCEPPKDKPLATNPEIDIDALPLNTKLSPLQQMSPPRNLPPLCKHDPPSKSSNEHITELD